MKNKLTNFYFTLLVSVVLGSINVQNLFANLIEYRQSDKQIITLLQSTKKEINMKDLFAWCIIPYDSKNRTPEERIEMLKELGFKSYAYDWREKHLNEAAYELRLANKNVIEIKAVWIWIDAQSDKPGKLSEANEIIFNALKETGTSTQIWLGFNENYFADLKQEDAIGKGVEMLSYLNDRAKESGSKIALYNHGGWFGEPENQVELIKQLPNCEIGIIYNFHHGHNQIEHFPQLIKIIKPYLWAVNLNGMIKEGPKILPIGNGDQEKQMIQMLLDSGFKGPFGILGHTENEDVKNVLKRNIEGLKALGF